MYVYHGSRERFNIAKPSHTRRGYINDNKLIIEYDDVSLHVSPYKWIAMAYMGKRDTYKHKGNKYKFNFFVPIKDEDDNFMKRNILIYGKRSLEYSLNKLYGEGGYLYTFKKDKFIWVKGLGMNELISYKEQKPMKIEYISDPVKEMRKLGVNFIFVNETKNMGYE
jgi:hypothetical protein